MTRTGTQADRWRNPERYRCPAPKCGTTRLFKDGFVHGKQRYKCKNCGCRTIAPKPARVKKEKG